jgi:hypothetical protein
LAYAAALRQSIRRNQLISGFQLPLFWSTKPSFPVLISRK